MSVSRDELQTLCNQLDKVYNLLREDYDDADKDLLRLKMMSCWRELKFYLDSIATP